VTGGKGPKEDAADSYAAPFTDDPLDPTRRVAVRVSILFLPALGVLVAMEQKITVDSVSRCS
jgi:hypothetical protein